MQLTTEQIWESSRSENEENEEPVRDQAEIARLTALLEAADLAQKKLVSQLDDVSMLTRKADRLEQEKLEVRLTSIWCSVLY